MTDPTNTIFGPAAVVAAREALTDAALTRLGRDLGTIHAEAIATETLRAAASAVLGDGTIPCTEGEECDGDDPEEFRLCDAHEAAAAHARGEHRWCPLSCRSSMPTQEMTNFVLARAYPGAAGALRELLRREAEDAVARVLGQSVDEDTPSHAVPAEPEDSGITVKADRYAVSPVPLGHDDYSALVLYVVRRREGWAVTDGAGWLATHTGAWTLDSWDALVFPNVAEARRVAVAAARGKLNAMRAYAIGRPKK